MTGRISADMERAIKLYKTGKLSVREAAKRAGVSYQGLYYALKREGVML